ncbi:hypothetical protein P692DRAFT_201857932 [Suillus brevipes Sb2]|nr:hypothetical protein P692DRAFT_201857932 [Suillus brevipes Sb2]
MFLTQEKDKEHVSNVGTVHDRVFRLGAISIADRRLVKPLRVLLVRRVSERFVSTQSPAQICAVGSVSVPKFAVQWLVHAYQGAFWTYSWSVYEKVSCRDLLIATFFYVLPLLYHVLPNKAYTYVFMAIRQTL